MFHELSSFVEILFNFKKKILAWIKGNLETFLILPKIKNLNWFHHVTLKLNLSKTHMGHSVESNFFKKFKVIASLPILHPYFRHFFLKKKRFLRESSKPGHGNLVLITLTAQVELSKLNFNLHDIRTYFLQVLRDCRQISFVTLNEFCPLNKKNPPPLFFTLCFKFWRYFL